MDLEGIRVSEISQSKGSAIWFHLYVESEKQNKWTNKQNRNRLINIENRGMVTMVGEGMCEIGEWDKKVQTSNYKIIQSQGFPVKQGIQFILLF